MTTKRSEKTQKTLRQLRQFEKQFARLRKKAVALRREERALLQRISTTLRSATSRRLLSTARGSETSDAHDHQPTTDSLTAVARMRGGSGLLCGCPPILIKPQPNGDIDICVLIDCSDDPSAGFHCHYYCGTIEAPPVVAIMAERSTK